ncbi:MAG TPA: class II aldolase/adducin family protein [Gemmatimonadaceae bacterium]|nr:class II aldolase/adducin family protein [Gemmatimonadaceae bacterium]
MTQGLEVRREIVRVCQRLWERGLIAGPDGNVSVRLRSDRILVTPAGLSKVDVRPEDLVELSLDGRKLRGRMRPSSEVGMHLRIYQRRPDVQAVVHAHPPTATGFAVAGEGFMDCVLPEVIFQVGSVPLVPYATPGTPALADSFEPYLDRHSAFLMANHGATTVGPSLLVAHQRMESLEHAARILLTARALGRVQTLSAEDVRQLEEARHRAVPGEPYPGCPAPGSGLEWE